MFRLSTLAQICTAVIVTVCCLWPARADAIPLTVCLSSSASGNCLSPSMPTTTVIVGDTFSLYMLVDGAVDLSSWNMSFGVIGWNSSALSLVSVAEGDFLKNTPTTCFGGPPCSTFFDPGIATVNSVTGMSGNLTDLTAGATGSGALAVFTFTSLAATNSMPVTFEGLFGFEPFLMQDSSDNFFDVPAIDGSVEAVPEPATLVLLGSGVVAAVARRVRRGRVQASGRSTI